MRSRLLWTLAAILLMTIIWSFSSQPSLMLPVHIVWDTIIRKTAHFLAYALLAWLWFGATARWRLALILTVGYAIIDEWHQTTVPGRHGWWLDVGIDALGAMTALAFSTCSDRARSIVGRRGRDEDIPK